jgi:class 3 adenylate cyclase/tetratricopeptide (TPR) repeat protein
MQMSVGSGLVRTCAACGSENPEGHRFCWSCGAALTAPTVERRKLVTSVFCDLSGSTAMAEQADDESVFELMRSYFDAARSALERHGGSVEKFIGDAVVGMFGVPEAHEDDALRACRAALEIQERVRAMNAGVAVRIGVNTGEAVAGDAARREMFASGDSVVLGDSVNVAARLEQAAAPGEVLIGDTTYRLVRNAVSAEPVAPIEAKGKSEPLVAFRLLDTSAHGQLPRGGGTALVGRTTEVELIETSLDRAEADRACRLVTLVGDAGVGKSRLVAEAIDRIGGRARVARGACLSYGEGITLWPIAEAVRELAGIGDDLGADEARTLVPLRIAQMLGLAEGSSTADQTAEAIAEFLAGGAAERPLVIVVDDIHWAEPALLDLLEQLPRLIGKAPVLLVCLARPELLEGHPDWPVTLRVEPLAAREVDALLESLDAPAESRVRLARAAAGNPLYAEELVAWVHEGGDVDDLPTSLTALLGARLDRLQPEERDALERGAVEGELFHRGAVVELTDEPSRASVPAGLDALNRKDMIRLTAASLAGEFVAYRFKHILVRDAAYRATTKKLRATLHERYADWLEQHAGNRVGEYHEILGYHLETAHHYRRELGTPDPILAARAARHLGAAGRRANDRSDVRAGANLLTRATGLLPLDSAERLELLRAYAHALNMSGRVVESRAVSEELYLRATALGEHRIAARGRRPGEQSWDGTVDLDLGELWARTEETLKRSTELGDESGIAGALRQLGMICFSRGRVAETVKWLERALPHALASGEVLRRQSVTQSLALQLTGGPTPVPEATCRCEELCEASRDDPFLEAMIFRCLSCLSAMAGRFDEWRAYERQAARVLDQADTLMAWISYEVAAHAAEYAGDLAAAERWLEKRWRAFRDTLDGAPDLRAIGPAYELALLYCDDGRWDDAANCLAFHGDVAFDQQSHAANRLAAKARLEAHRGELSEAVTHAKQAVHVIDVTDELNGRARIWRALADVQRAAGDTEAAADAVAAALALYEQKGNVAAAEHLRSTVASA